MCGFIAQVFPAGSRLTQGAAVAASLRHRGPDGEGRYVDESNGRVIRLYHARLKIIDLSDAAAQPMAGCDPSVRLVFNGEIYRFQALRTQLQGLGHVFRSGSDTEVLLRALEEWGEGALERIQGMFAFALWDGRDGSLLVARDRLGIKPLYYARHDGGITFGSEVRAVLAAGAPFEVDPSAVASYLAFGSVTAPRTIVRGIHELPPAHLAWFRNGTLEVRRFWSPPRLAASPGSEREAAVEVGRRLRASVESQLVSDVPIGIFLSAGMDSRALASCAAELRDGDVDTFTVAFRGEDAAWSEAGEAAQYAAQLGVRHHVVPVNQDDALEHVDDIIGAFDQPSVDGPNIWVISRAIRRAGLTVALSGLGADEVFGGYNHLRSAWLHRRYYALATLLAPLARILAPALRGLRPKNLRLEKGFALLTALGDARSVYAARRSLLPERTLRDMASNSLEELRTGSTVQFLSPAEVTGRDGIDAQTVLELSNYLSNTLLRDADVMAMRHGLEVRVPFLDESLVEHVLTLPPGWRVKSNRQKPLLSAAVPKIGTHSAAAKRGFVLPFANWLRGALRTDVERRLLRLKHAGTYVRPGAVADLWRRFVAGDDRLWARVWAIYVLDRWIERSGALASAATARRRVSDE
jgi:asparagine synthase (glutamine-hydrolysing)